MHLWANEFRLQSKRRAQRARQRSVNTATVTSARAVTHDKSKRRYLASSKLMDTNWKDRDKHAVRGHGVSSATRGGQTEMSPLLFGLTVVINSVCIKHNMLFTPKDHNWALKD